MKRPIRRRTWRSAGTGLLLGLAACSVNPATGERELSLVSESQEIQIGRDSDPAVTAQMGGVYPDSSLQRYVRGLGLELAAAGERPELPWSFKLLDDELVNAFALPGGFVYITRGILANMNSEAELVAVLGHEAGHVTARHTAGRITRMQLGQLGLGLGMIFSETVRQYGQAAATGLQLLFLSYGREDERQADELGFRYMTRINYNPDGMTSVMRMLQSTSASAESAMPTWLSSHPDPGNRLQANQERIAESTTDFSSYRTNRDTFLERLDGLVYGMDPRQGYFIGQRFLQPTLRFEITFPSGWRKANGAQAVQAGPASNDALIALTFASASSAAAGAAEVRSMEGLTATRAYDGRVNGLTASFVEFDLQTQGGILRGMVMYIEQGSSVFEIVAYGTESSWGGHRAAADAALRSFANLTSARHLDVAPHRIDIVRLPRAMTFDDFMRQYPSSVPVDDVRLANQVASGESLASGRLMKRITGGRVPTN
ncbi:MAG TPA: M48 family metalloprotease [Longimicrobiales bacterium]|nr:M48 family metalloprotease [Longimicrobiales bacterium]